MGKTRGFVLSIAVALFGCTAQPSEPAEDAPSRAKADSLGKQIPPENRDDLRHDGIARQERREASVAETPVPQLVDDLRQDSQRGFEPFNSPAFATILREKGEGIKEELSSALDKEVFLLGLLALRRLDEQLYREVPAEKRVKALTDALRTSELFNLWGLPHVHWQEAAAALVAEGDRAKVALRALFSDKRKARLWGSREAHESAKYGYRVCDYAWALYLTIDGTPDEKLRIPLSPAARDALIAKT